MSLLTDPWFYAVALPAVTLTGLSKGGFQGASLLAMPLLALVMNPIQAAAIMLPVLMFQDVFSVWAYRRTVDWTVIKLMLPGILAGTAIAAATASVVTPDMIRLIVGVTALTFTANALLRRQTNASPKPHNAILAAFWGMVSAFTSFLVHAGGAPYTIYALPRRKSPQLYVGTTAVTFAFVNLFKVGPYLWLGQLSRESLLLSAVLFPMAGIANLAGIWLVRRMALGTFYKILYGLLLVVSLKLIFDGVTGLLR